MKILHIIHPDRKFAGGAVRFIDKLNKRRSDFIHEILFVNLEGNYSLLIDNVEITQREVFLKKFEFKKFIQITNLCKKYDYIIFHSLFFYVAFKFVYALNYSVLRKTIWIEFGGDLYFHNNLRTMISNFPNILIGRSCFGFVGIMPCDLEEYKHKFPQSKANLYSAPYFTGELPEEYKHYKTLSSLETKLRMGTTIKVLIGNNASQSLRHIETLDILSRFANEDIKIIIPLSYGNENYAKEVQAYSKNIFGDKAECLTEFMNEEDYFDYIKDVDIAIFNTHRQQGLGNINRLIFRNTKLYIPEQSPMYKHFILCGVPINNFSDLANESFDAFKRLPVIKDTDKFQEYIKTFYTLDNYIEKWEYIYNDLKNKVSR